MSHRKKNVPRYMDSTTSSATKHTERRLGGTPKSNVSKCLDTTNVSSSSRAESVSSNCSIVSSITNTHPSQKYMQHKLDMAYNKYVQNKALDIYLTRKYKELERTIDEQLSHYEEIYQGLVEDDENKKRLLRDLQMVQDAALRIQFLENALDKTCSIISDEEFTKKVQNCNQQLHIICDRLLLKNFEFEQSEENYAKLDHVLTEMSAILQEVSGDRDNDLVVILDSICKISELLVKLKKNNEIVQNYHAKVNMLTLRAASLELSKKYK